MKNIKEMLVDSQTLTLIDKEFIFKHPDELDNKGLSLVKEIIIRQLSLVLDENDILFSIGKPYEKSFPYFLWLHDNEPYRIFIETISCQNCDKRLVIGNPYVSDCYMGVDMSEIVLKAKPLLKMCPNCNQDMGRPAIWIKEDR